MATKNTKPTMPPRGVQRIPQESLLYARVIPFLLILFGVLLVVIILFSVGLVLGVVRVP